MAARLVTREEFDKACQAVWSEIQYQNRMADVAPTRRTDDEAKDVPGFCSLLDVYVGKTKVAWADTPGEVQPDGRVQVPAALHGLRKITAIALRAMIYNGVRFR